MDCGTKCFTLVLVISLVIGYFIYSISQPPQLQEISLRYWGPGKQKPDDKTIKKFKISFPESDIKELKEKLTNTRSLVGPLEDVGFQYGFNTVFLNKLVEFWKNEYNWTEREAFLNQYPQFTTQIGGLNIHYIHVKPEAARIKGKEVLPLLVIHGWPGSVVEFYKIIPMLTTPRPNIDFVFELIIPSLPGYGFSQASSKQGLHAAHMGLIFNELMARLGFQKYYVHGGDWGSFIGQSIAVLLPERVLGYHSNFCLVMTKKAQYYMLLFYLFPEVFVEESKQEQFTTQFKNLLLETGYSHLQSTKPDTLGVALTDSPVGLAAYILEKFSTWTNGSWRSLPDGGLEIFDKVEILDNVMIYWLTKSITTSMRLYKETFGSSDFSQLGILQNRVGVPSACVLFGHEIVFFPKLILEEGFDKLVSVSYISKGGHFAAFEEPKLLSDEVWKFLETVRTNRKYK